jgi:tRNA (adenine22-N1)-methyltransferase
MIKLSNRLNEIASFIHKEDIIIDIGCDHALLDIYLVNKYNNICYASDINENALKNAIANIKKYSLEDKIIIKHGDGLTIDNSLINTIVIAGMGFNNIIKILSNKEVKGINKIIVQSNSQPETIRKFMIKRGYYLNKENIVLDKGKYYVISEYLNNNKHNDFIDMIIGKYELNDISKKYIKHEISKNSMILYNIPNKMILKKIKLKFINKLLMMKSSK